MSRYQLKCSCIHCHTETTIQSLKAHISKCTAQPKNICGCCGKPTNNDKFCSASCRATVTNALRPKKEKIDLAAQRREREYQRFVDGKIAERSSLRKYLTISTGYACAHCGLSSWNNKPITLIVDHIDGNAGDNRPINLQLLCPNCNSQTPTFGGRNKGNGRKARGLPTH